MKLTIIRLFSSLLLILLMPLALAQGFGFDQSQIASELEGDFNEAYYPIKTLNAGLPKLNPPANRQSPQALIIFFEQAIAKQDYLRAAHALNLNLINPEDQPEQGAELAKKLAFLLENGKVINYKTLSDRPDALIESIPGTSQSNAGKPQRSIKLGELDRQHYKQTIRLQRVRVNELAPIWVFSANTVDSIEQLYQIHAPTKLEQALPQWIKIELFSIALWEYLLVAILLALGILIGRLISLITEKIAGYLKEGIIQNLIRTLTRPITFTIALGLLYGITSGLIIGNKAIASSLRPIMWISFVFAAIWLGTHIINFFADRYKSLQITPLDDDQSSQHRCRMTYLSIGRRVFTFSLILIGIVIMLSEFINIKLVGASLLTSAGVLSIILGVAAQPLLANIVAGIQVAITRPIRIGDTIVIHDEWVVVEELTYTYAILLTWDERRLIVPMRDFVTEPLINWSHTNQHMRQPVFLYVDYSIDLEALKKHFIEQAKAHENWCQKVEPDLLILEYYPTYLKLRGQVSANTPNLAWSMAKDLREIMLTYLQQNAPNALPRERVSTLDPSSATLPSYLKTSQ